jgi:hypothetical protein
VSPKIFFVMIPFVLLVLGFSYAKIYSSESARVINAIDFNNDVYNSTILKYKDLSTEARIYITKEEFNKWTTWEDVEFSFLKFNYKKGDADFVTHGKYAVVYSFYEKTITGYKLSYLKFDW